MTANPLVVAVDGPSGSGKSSVSRAAAVVLGFRFLDTGALYRAFAWHALDRAIDLDVPGSTVAALDDFVFSLPVDPDDRHVSVRGTDVTQAIRSTAVTAAVSSVARVPEVRARLTAVFREAIADAPGGIVVEGRDITTVVAPDARVRVLLTAAPEARAARRAHEVGADARSIAASLAARDAKDSTVVDFLTAAPGVTTLDSTDLDFARTVDALVALVRAAQQEAQRP